jgi:acetylornithine deacetylase/succinyl-diaminopimelate desuccinylase-like protein
MEVNPNPEGDGDVNACREWLGYVKKGSQRLTHRLEPMIRIDEMHDTLVRDLRELVRVPTVNPPSEHHEQFCQFEADLARACNNDVDLLYIPEEEIERHYPWGRGYPRVNVLGRYRRSKRSHTGMHLLD